MERSILKQNFRTGIWFLCYMGQNDDGSKKANELDEATLNRSQNNVNFVKVKQRHWEICSKPSFPVF